MCENKKKDGTNYNIYTDGLKIYTTINSRMQQYAEDAVKEHLGDYLQPIFFKEKREVRMLRMHDHYRKTSGRVVDESNETNGTLSPHERGGSFGTTDS